MATYLVTGAAGFIGSHLSEALVGRGDRVIGIDAFIPYYPETWKRSNLAGLMDHECFEFHAIDLRTDTLAPLVDKADTIVHLAAMPGLRRSWPDFDLYVSCNLQATQRLLEAVREAGIDHFIHGSTSSVYGREATGPETMPLKPVSPYGVTKLAAENLCQAYATNFDVPVTILRFFSVYGPRQRPDMAYTILIDALINGKPFTRYGDGEQTRSNTFVADIVQAILRASQHRDAALGEVFNVGGGDVVSLNQAIGILEDIMGAKARIEAGPLTPGDQKHTRADIGKAEELLNYRPATPVHEGLEAQVKWFRSRAPQS